MQCPFLIPGEKTMCETGSFGMIRPKSVEVKRYCTGRSYYLCQVYRANTGTSVSQESLDEISARLIQVPSSPRSTVNPL